MSEDAAVAKIFEKIDHLSDAHSRTREDMVEIKGAVKSVAEAAGRIEARQHSFEQEVNGRLEDAANAAKHAMSIFGKEITGRVEVVEGEVKTIREERIAEKAQWRGPEKVIVTVAGLATLIGAIIAGKQLFGF